MTSFDLPKIVWRHALVESQDKRYIEKVAHHDRGVLLQIINKIEESVSLIIGEDCTVEEFCKALQEYQHDSNRLEFLERAIAE